MVTYTRWVKKIQNGHRGANELRGVGYMSPKERFMSALYGGRVDRPAVGSATSVISVEVMDEVGVHFPAAHLDPYKMAELAMAAHTVLGHDNVAPLFSAIHDASGLDVSVDWGDRTMMPEVKEHPWTEVSDIKMPPDYLDREGVRVPIDAIRILKKELGNRVAIVGKVYGPWSLAYHMFGVQDFLIWTLLEPDKVRAILRGLMEIVVTFANAQVEAGADALCYGDHATGDLVSRQMYVDFLRDLHKEIRQRINAPLILHICGNTLDRMPDIAKTTMTCFHFDSSVDPAAAKAAVNGKISLMGNIDNAVTLLTGTPADVRTEVFRALDAGIEIIGPACAVPLTAPMANLLEIRRSVDAYIAGR
jgi:MtaA/CmuA family methyltransferase